MKLKHEIAWGANNLRYRIKKIVLSSMTNVWLNIHLMYVSGQLFLTNGDLEYISKAYVHGEAANTR